MPVKLSRLYVSCCSSTIRFYESILKGRERRCLYQVSKGFPRNLIEGLCFYLMTVQKEVRRNS